MAKNLMTKKLNYVSRLTVAVNNNTNQINDLVALFEECGASGFISGVGVANADAVITDEDLTVSFPHLNAADLAEVVGSLAAVKQFLDSGGHTAVFLKMRP